MSQNNEIISMGLTSGSKINGWIPNFLRFTALSTERQVPLITHWGNLFLIELTSARPVYPSPKMKTWEGMTSTLWIWREDRGLVASVVKFVDATRIKTSKVMLERQCMSQKIDLILDGSVTALQVKRQLETKYCWFCSIDMLHAIPQCIQMHHGIPKCLSWMEWEWVCCDNVGITTPSGKVPPVVLIWSPFGDFPRNKME